MGRHVSVITDAELDAISRAAAEEAIADTLAKGVSVMGYLPDDIGNIWLARRHPSGEIDWLELVKRVDSASADALAPAKRAG